MEHHNHLVHESEIEQTNVNVRNRNTKNLETRANSKYINQVEPDLFDLTSQSSSDSELNQIQERR